MARAGGERAQLRQLRGPQHLAGALLDALLTMHGDEPAGFVLMLRLIANLLEDWGTDPALTDLVNTTEIWVNPLANPDGTYFARDDTVAGAIRRYTTAAGDNSGVDPNRNYPYEWGGVGATGDTRASQDAKAVSKSFLIRVRTWEALP
mgnify:CR=1 FL=1